MKLSNFIKVKFIILLTLIPACSLSEPTKKEVPSLISPSVEESKQVTVSPDTESLDVQVDPFEQATEMAIAAEKVGEEARYKEQWTLAITRWEEAIILIKSVPSSSPNYRQAKKNLKQYQRKLNIAHKKAERSPSFPPVPPPTPPDLPPPLPPPPPPGIIPPTPSPGPQTPF